MYDPAFGRLIKWLREQRGITQEQLANLCGVTSSYISQVEQARRVPTSESLLRRLSGALHYDYSELANQARRTKSPDTTLVVYEPHNDGGDVEHDPYLKKLELRLRQLRKEVPEDRYEEMLDTLVKFTEFLLQHQSAKYVSLVDTEQLTS